MVFIEPYPLAHLFPPNYREDPFLDPACPECELNWILYLLHLHEENLPINHTEQLITIPEGNQTTVSLITKINYGLETSIITQSELPDLEGTVVQHKLTGENVPLRPLNPLPNFKNHTAWPVSQESILLRMEKLDYSVIPWSVRAMFLHFFLSELERQNIKIGSEFVLNINSSANYLATHGLV